MVQTIPTAVEANLICQTPPISQSPLRPGMGLCPAKCLGPSQRRDLAVRGLAGSATITDLAEEAQVSRRFVYRQIDIADSALEQGFSAPTEDDDKVLIQVNFTRKTLRQNALSLILNCRSSYRGVRRHFQDCYGCDLSLGSIHNVVRDTARLTRAANLEPSLKKVEVGMLDEIYQGKKPVLVGVDAHSSYCFLLEQETHRDIETWGVRLLDQKKRGLDPEAFVADFASGLRGGCAVAFPDTDCRGDVFHGLRKVVPVVSALEKQAYHAISDRDKLERKSAEHWRRNASVDPSLRTKLTNAKTREKQAIALADDVALLADWLRHDILSLSGPSVAERRALYDFIVAELRVRAPQSPKRLPSLCVFLANHRDQLLAFAERLDQDLAELALRHQVPVDTLRDLLHLLSLSHAHPRRWPNEARLRRQLGSRFHDLLEALRALAEKTVRASSLVENLNGRLRHYFSLRRHLGADYLTLLQFYFNHRRFDRSDCPHRVGKSPSEILTGSPHPHWLQLLGYQPFSKI